ncbi:replication factor A2 [Geopyxis carbonaria]|nr:replication factor A2 [Geopyxis carbonaria]
MSYGYGNQGNYGGGEYQTTSYGGGGGAEGGGFMNNNNTFGGTQGGSQTPGGAGKDRNKSTIRPVTIKQVLDAISNHEFSNDNVYKIDDHEVTHITIVARVSNVTEQTTNITFVINDGTAQIDAKKWIDSEAPPDSTSQQMNGQYIRCIGQIRGIGNKRHVAVHAVRLVTDYNEVQYHLLEATAMHLHYTRGPASQFTGGEEGAATSYNTGGVVRDTAMGGMGGMGGAPGVKAPPGTSNAARIVLETIKAQATDSNDGMHTHMIAQRSGLKLPEVTKAVDELLRGGMAFTTLDDNHIAIMEL